MILTWNSSKNYMEVPQNLQAPAKVLRVQEVGKHRPNLLNNLFVKDLIQLNEWD